MPIEQSGNVTPGHVAIWTTTGVVSDGGPLRSATNVLASLGSANFNSTSDQALTLPNTITAFQISGILITNPSISLTTAAGGFYADTSKTGVTIVAAAQGYTNLTAAAKLLSATLAQASTVTFSSANCDSVDGHLTIYLSLTTPQGAAATADVYLLGNDLTITG